MRESRPDGSQNHTNFPFLKEDELYCEDGYECDDRIPAWAKDLLCLDLAFSNKEGYDKYFTPHEVGHLTTSHIARGERSLSHNFRCATIECFEIGRPVGGGLFGVTYIARHKDLYVAIKVIYKKENRLKAILEEAKILSELDHSNIIHLYDVFHDEVRIYLVMEYAPGGDLKDLINSKRIPEHSAKEIFVQTLRAVTECHRNSIVHRDIKLENFVIGKDNIIKLIDFGLSFKFHTGDIVIDCCGTLDYLSPEMITRSPYSYEVDIWALGVLLYELVNRHTPFEDDDIIVTKTNIKYISCKFNNNSNSPDLEDLFNRIFQPAKKRISIPGILSHPWLSQ